jgi:hypothetical protein
MPLYDQYQEYNILLPVLLYLTNSLPPPPPSTQLHWLDDDDINIHLDGPPLFLRACILGQLQHSHLHKPVFPVCLDQELTFDRVRCKKINVHSFAVHSFTANFNLLLGAY